MGRKRKVIEEKPAKRRGRPAGSKNKVFDGIKKGLEQAVAFSEGDTSEGRLSNVDGEAVNSDLGRKSYKCDCGHVMVFETDDVKKAAREHECYKCGGRIILSRI